MKVDLVKISKFLSYVLRHNPDAIGLTLDPHGWTSVDELLGKAEAAGTPIERGLLLRVVNENDKQRFALSEDGLRIRANQGHSLKVDLALPESQPPAILFHGTADRFLDSIRAAGLVAGSRHDVHLSTNRETAEKVGQRHGVPIVLAVDAERMSNDGYRFRCSENGVWLTETVPPNYILFNDCGDKLVTNGE